MRKDTREHLEQLELACELAKLIRHFFPGLVPLLKKLPDPRNQSYTTYPGAVLLMTRILSSIFYISSMRKTSEEFNSDTVIENVWSLCGEEPAVDELPYWEAIDHYLKRMDPCGLQEAINSCAADCCAAVPLRTCASGGSTGRSSSTGRSCTARGGSWMEIACTASTRKGRRTSTRKAIIMSWKRSWCCFKRSS